LAWNQEVNWKLAGNVKIDAEAELGLGRYLTFVHSGISLLHRINFQRPIIGVWHVNASKSLIVYVRNVGKGKNLKVALSDPGHL
jgi:hypothetical protein